MVILLGGGGGLPAQLGLSLDLVWATGHRIGAVLDLRWEHVKLDPEEAARLAASLDSEVDWSPEHFPLGGIHWYAGKGTDNKKHEHVSPMSVLARDAIMEARPDIVGPGWLFPAPMDATKRIGYHVLKRWFEKAEKQAELPHLKGGLWHPFRRGWATARKHLPIGDVAKGGGWKETATVQKCYVQADGGTILAVVNAE